MPMTSTYLRFQVLYFFFSFSALLVVALTLVFLNPLQNVWALYIFYAAVLVGVASIIYVFEVFLRSRFFVSPYEIVKKQARRHGVVVAVMVLTYLLLLSQDLLSWWLSASIILLAAATEAVFNL